MDQLTLKLSVLCFKMNKQLFCSIFISYIFGMVSFNKVSGTWLLHLSNYSLSNSCSFGLQVKIIKCLVENIVVDISFNQLGGLCTLCFLEEVSNIFWMPNNVILGVINNASEK